jgi:hypothetical protein
MKGVKNKNNKRFDRSHQRISLHPQIGKFRDWTAAQQVIVDYDRQLAIPRSIAKYSSFTTT